LTESDTVTRIQALTRTATQSLTHSELIARIQGHVRTISQSITHSSIVVAVKTGGSAPAIAKRVKHVIARGFKR